MTMGNGRSVEAGIREFNIFDKCDNTSELIRVSFRNTGAIKTGNILTLKTVNHTGDNIYGYAVCGASERPMAIAVDDYDFNKAVHRVVDAYWGYGMEVTVSAVDDGISLGDELMISGTDGEVDTVDTSEAFVIGTATSDSFAFTDSEDNTRHFVRCRLHPQAV